MSFWSHLLIELLCILDNKSIQVQVGRSVQTIIIRIYHSLPYKWVRDHWQQTSVQTCKQKNGIMFHYIILNEQNKFISVWYFMSILIVSSFIFLPYFPPCVYMYRSMDVVYPQWYTYECKTENCDASIFKVFKILVINYLNQGSKLMLESRQIASWNFDLP